MQCSLFTCARTAPHAGSLVFRVPNLLNCPCHTLGVPRLLKEAIHPAWLPSWPLIKYMPLNVHEHSSVHSMFYTAHFPSAQSYIASCSLTAFCKFSALTPVTVCTTSVPRNKQNVGVTLICMLIMSFCITHQTPASQNCKCIQHSLCQGVHGWRRTALSGRKERMPHTLVSALSSPRISRKTAPCVLNSAAMRWYFRANICAPHPNNVVLCNCCWTPGPLSS